MKISTYRFAFVSGFLLWGSFAQAQTSPVYQTVSIIGSGTVAGWSADTPMRLASPGDVHNWTVTLPLSAGQGSNEVKFRANNDWTVNWGAATFPTGTGTANGANIPIASANTYTVQFNDVTGAYRFTVGALASKTSGSLAVAPALYPNPAHHAATLSGVAAGATVQVFDAVGRLALTTTADATGAATLAVPTGLYVVRSGFAPALRLVVE